MIRRLSPLLILLALLTLSLAPAQAEEPALGSVRIDGDVELLPDGDARANVVIDFPRAQYSDTKASTPNPYRFLRDFESSRSNYEIAPDASARYDDAKTAVVLELTERGSLTNLGDGNWELQIESAAEFVSAAPAKDGRVRLHFYETGRFPQGIEYKGQLRYLAPAGAQDVRFDAGHHSIRYTLPHGEGQGPARLAVEFTAKPRLMSSLYKVYGLGTAFAAQWVAKGILRNSGESVIHDLQVRYRLDHYTDWSVWLDTAEMVPGQSVVLPYYPVIDDKIAHLTSNTPANVRMQWHYTDAEGHAHEGGTGDRTVILGRHEFVFSNLARGASDGTFHESMNNAPLLAAWVSRDDMVVKQFAAMGNKIAGGKGAGHSFEDGMLVLAGLYELMRRNDFSYQHPPTLADHTVSYDPRSVQNIKFPRDVIRDRSGTCIDLAICYAALANAVGIDARLALIPGHCFPVFHLKGGIVALEATGVAGGRRFGSYSFKDIHEAGMKTLRSNLATGQIVFVNLRDLWTRGVSNPELPELPADILTRWGLSVDGPQIQAKGRPAQDQQKPQQETPPEQKQQVRRSPFTGTWTGSVRQVLPGGRTVSFPVALEIQRARNGGYVINAVAQATLPSGYGTVTLRVKQRASGQIQNGRLVFRGIWKTQTLLETGQEQRVTPDVGVAWLDGGSLVGKSGNDADGYVQWRLARRG